MWLIAHGIVGRADLPIPVIWFAVAAAAVLVVSFLALAGGWERPRLEQVRERPLFRLPLAVEVVLGALGVFVFAFAVYAGLAGHRESAGQLGDDRGLRRLLGRRRRSSRSCSATSSAC